MQERHLRPLTIGEFGRRSGLSVKALRLYEVSGLLPPARVDPATGYRRYAADQLERAQRISLLRQLDMPLAVVAEVLAGTDEEALIRLDRWWRAQEAAADARRGTLSYVRERFARSESGERPQHPVHRRRVPAAKVATIRADADQQALVETLRRAEWEIRAHLEASGAVTTAEHWLLFHGFVTPDSEAPVEVCVPFTGAVEPAGRIAVRVEAAHTQIYTTVTRDDCYYPRIMYAYDALQEHRATACVAEAGPPREIYLAAWHDIAGTDPFVDVALPILE
jgi:DNA-binding transcriptional MerR regulator